MITWDEDGAITNEAAPAGLQSFLTEAPGALALGDADHYSERPGLEEPASVSIELKAGQRALRASELVLERRAPK